MGRELVDVTMYGLDTDTNDQIHEKEFLSATMSSELLDLEDMANLFHHKQHVKKLTLVWEQLFGPRRFSRHEGDMDQFVTFKKKKKKTKDLDREQSSSKVVPEELE